MQRLRLFDLRLSRFPTVFGACQSDTRRIADMANTVQERLVYAKEASEDGWFGGWTEMAFTVSRTNPYLTLPRQVARLEAVDVCQNPRPVQNQFYEYLRFGSGRMPKTFRCQCWPGMTQIYARNIVPTFTDLSNPPQMLRAYFTDPADFGKRVLLQGNDAAGNVIYTQDGLNQVTGEYLNLRSPFSTAVNQFSTISGIQKDMTSGPVQVMQVDPTSGEQVLLLTMEPSETVSGYRRYLFNPLPRNCCPGDTSTNSVSITAICKLDLIPMQVDQDYCLIQSKEAFIEEAQSVRLSEADSTSAKAMAAERHIQAIRMLNGQLTHFEGMNEPAIDFAPWGNARLVRQRIGTLT